MAYADQSRAVAGFVPVNSGHVSILRDASGSRGTAVDAAAGARRPRGKEEGQQQEEEGGGSSAAWGAIANLVNCIVGAGIIGIPWAIAQCGVVTGVLCLLFVVYLLSQSGVLIVQLGLRERCYSLEDLAESLLGPFGFVWVASTMAAFAFGGMTAYIVILGDVLPPVLETVVPSSMSLLYSREIAVAVFSTVIILPLCLMRSMASLATASTLSVLADAVLIVIVLASGPSEASRQDIDRSYSTADLTSTKQGLFAGIGAMSFAFVCHHNALIVFQSLRSKDRQLAMWRRVVFAAEGLALLLSIALGVGGCIIFGPQVAGDIINEFESTGSAVCVAKILLAACMILTHPVECFIARHSILSMIERYQSFERKKVQSNRLPWSPLQFYRARRSSSRYDRLSLSRHAHSGVPFETELRDISSTVDMDQSELHLNESPNSLAGGRGFEGGGDEEVIVDFRGSTPTSGDAANTTTAAAAAGVAIISTDRELSSGDTNEVSKADHHQNDLIFTLLTIALWGLSTFLALVFTDLAVVLAFVGCVTAAMVGYIIPSALFFASYKVEVSTWLRYVCGRCGSGQYAPPRPPLLVPALLGVFGLCVLGIGLATILLT